MTHSCPAPEPMSGPQLILISYTRRGRWLVASILDSFNNQHTLQELVSDRAVDILNNVLVTEDDCKTAIIHTIRTNYGPYIRIETI